MHFHSLIRAKKRLLRMELRNLSLDNCTVSDYLLRIQTPIDSLLSIGDFVSQNEHLDVTLEGVPEEYESTVTLISSKFGPLTIDEVETLLLAHEAWIDKFHWKSLASVNFTKSVKPNSGPISTSQTSQQVFPNATSSQEPQANLAQAQNDSTYSTESNCSDYNGVNRYTNSGCGGSWNFSCGGCGRLWSW